MLTMGNIVNKDLIILFEKNIDQIEADLSQNKVVELSNDTVTVHFWRKTSIPPTRARLTLT